jgi:hypothetical protein
MMAILDVPDYLEQAVKELMETLGSKGDDYGKDVDPWSSFRACAAFLNRDLATVAASNVQEKLSRLSSLHANGREPRHEAIRDTYRDIAGFGVLAYAMYLEQVNDTPVIPTAISTATVRSDTGQHSNNPENNARTDDSPTVAITTPYIETRPSPHPPAPGTP